VDATNSSVRDRFFVTGVPNPCKTATSDLCPHASFTPDNQTAYVVAGSNLYVSTAGSTLKTIPLGTAANDVAVTAQGSFAFVANGDASVVPYATCDNAKLSGNTVTASAALQRILSSVDGTTLYGIAPPNLNIISPSTNAVGCVPSLTDPLTTVDLGQGVFNVRQVLRSTNGNRVYVITGGNNVVGYDKSNNAGFGIGLSGSANGLSGAITPDGLKVYVGGSDNRVHIIDTPTNTETGTISVSFTPDLVAVRPQ
jgi:YVTN family beta-propeller protein